MSLQPAVRLYLLGSPHLTVNGTSPRLGSRFAEALLYYVVLQPYPVERSVLVRMLWPNHNRQDGLRRLRTELCHVRKVLPRHVSADQTRIWLARDADIWADVWDLSAAVKAGNAQPGLLSLYRGDFLDGFELDAGAEFDDWVVGHQIHFAHLARRGYAGCFATLRTAGKLRLALTVATAWCRLAPLDEEANEALISLLAITGNRPLALQQYDRYARRLWAQMGIRPSVRLQQRAAHIGRLERGSVADEGPMPFSVAV